MKEKTFYKTLLRFSKDPENAKEKLADKRLSIVEKKILTGYLNIRDNQNQEVIALLKEESPSDLEFVESQRLLLLGCALNNISNYSQAEPYLLASIKILKTLEAPYFHFFAHFILFWIKANQNDTISMEKNLKEMVSIPTVSEQQKTRLLRCQFCYYQMTEQNNNAMKTLAKIESSKSSLSESDSIHFLTDKFIFYIQLEDFNKSYEALNEMRSYRKFHMSENYRFMKKLLDHIAKDKPIYAYNQDFEKVPLLLHQIKLIQSLEENKIEEARTHWHSLKSISPQIYADDFKYQGNKCLFSLCLEKHRQNLHVPKEIDFSENASKIDVLINLLSASPAPLAAGLIFEQIWQRPLEDKDDLKRLARLIFRAKSERNLLIESRKGTYHIKRHLSKKTA